MSTLLQLLLLIALTIIGSSSDEIVSRHPPQSPSPLFTSPQLGIYLGTVAGVSEPEPFVALDPENIHSPAPASPPLPYTRRWRTGVGAPTISPLAYEWPEARPGWFHNWTFGIIGVDGAPARIEDVRLALADEEAALGMAYMPMLRTPGGRLYFTHEMIGQVAAAYPGSAWLIGNEPDVATQDWATPTEYARAFHFAHQAIKDADPTAILVAGNLSQITPLRLHYLDLVWEAYEAEYGEEMPVDVWGMHAFVLHEEANAWGVGIPPAMPPEVTKGMMWTVEDHDDLALVEWQVVRMRRWMAAHGARDKPLWVTEYGILLPEDLGFTPERVERFMLDSFEFFETLRDPEFGLAEDDDRLVQRWLWFSTRFSELPAGNLFNATGQPTQLMDAMSDYLTEDE